jgi:hypothetical protein
MATTEVCSLSLSSGSPVPCTHGFQQGTFVPPPAGHAALQDQSWSIQFRALVGSCLDGNAALPPELGELSCSVIMLLELSTCLPGLTP